MVLERTEILIQALALPENPPKVSYGFVEYKCSATKIGLKLFTQILHDKYLLSDSLLRSVRCCLRSSTAKDYHY